MKRAKILYAVLAFVALCLPAVAAAEEGMETHVRENFYSGAGHRLFPDAARPILLGGGFAFNFGPRPFLSTGAFDGQIDHLFSHRNIFQQIYGDSGLDGAAFSYRLGDGTELSAFGAFDAGSDDPLKTDGYRPDRAYGVEMATRASVLDLAIRYAEARDDGVDVGLSTERVLIPVRWRLVSAGVSADLGDLGLHAEGGRAWSNAETDRETADLATAYSHFLVGIDYTFENNLYLVLEYFQEGQAESGEGIADLPDRPGLLTGNGEILGRDNYLVGARYPITDLTSIEFYNIVNDGDAAVMVNPWLILNAGDAFSLKLSAHIPFAKTDRPPEDAAAAAFGGIQLNF